MISGLLLIKKPKSLTSFDVIKIARKRLGVKKIGHAGTLDPFATGLLVVAVGEATKALNYLQKADKKYLATFEFGKSSDTHDIEGKIVHNSDRLDDVVQPIHSREYLNEPIALSLDRCDDLVASRQLKKLNNTFPFINREYLEKILKEFIGEIDQTPPKYSAVKINGKRACDRMRKGEEVEIESKKVKVFDLQILEFSYPKIKLLIHCGSGFYVRSLARDLGKRLKTGAICTELERISVGNFDIKNAIIPEEISNEKIIQLKPEHFDFPAIQVTKEDIENIKLGRKVAVKNGTDLEIASAFMSDQIIAFGKIQNGFFEPKRVLK